MLDNASTYDGLLDDLFSMGISLLDVLAEVEDVGTGVARFGLVVTSIAVLRRSWLRPCGGNGRTAICHDPRR